LLPAGFATKFGMHLLQTVQAQSEWHAQQCPERMANEKRIGRLMRLMGLMPIYQIPNTRRPKQNKGAA